ncbi:hypothetical protein ARMSODRAFT_972962 [Armillaria solidipes]|uniref:Uncharacterized protein n=1 Tax=Armillaria solidipes TaxID=1076256 RepID=A0A2H3CAL6_9AGAR|nr:hypothetical protein ARMSODRAFT_972962 [Armillaria solidipes]
MELEPIVWARLLHKVLPFGPDDRDIAQHFFKIIPSNYWRANFVVPPPVYEWEDIKIIENANNQPDRLTTTFCDSLYPWVGEGIFQGQLNITDSIFNPESLDDYPSPQDPKLRFLLTMVGSRSAIVLPNAFCQAISNIEAFCGYTMLFYWDHPLLPIVELSSHRHAILKLLYTLLSSDHFGKKEVPVEHQRAALALFLRMVKSTSPRPPFMARDWCTPDLAAEFVRIAFEDGGWAPMDAFDNCPDIVSELIHLLIQFPPIMSQAFEYAVAKRLFDRLIEAHYNRHNLRSSYYVLQVLKMFIDGLPSSKLESQISRNFLGYLHEPDVLFAVCAFLVGGGFSEALHDLARLRPNDPTWPVCIQRLREYVYRPAGVPDGHERPGILADLTAFLEGGGVESSSVLVLALIRSYVDELSVTNACVPHILGCIVKLAIFNVKAGAIVPLTGKAGLGPGGVASRLPFKFGQKKSSTSSCWARVGTLAVEMARFRIFGGDSLQTSIDAAVVVAWLMRCQGPILGPVILPDVSLPAQEGKARETNFERHVIRVGEGLQNMPVNGHRSCKQTGRNITGTKLTFLGARRRIQKFEVKKSSKIHEHDGNTSQWWALWEVSFVGTATSAWILGGRGVVWSHFALGKGMERSRNPVDGGDEVGGGDGADARRPGSRGSWSTKDSYSPTKIIGDVRIWGPWDGCMGRGTSMLVFGRAGSGGRENCRMTMIVGTLVAPSTPPSIRKRVISLHSSPPPSIPKALNYTKIVPRPRRRRRCPTGRCRGFTRSGSAVADEHRYRILRYIQDLEGPRTSYTGAIGTDITAREDCSGEHMGVAAAGGGGNGPSSGTATQLVLG